MSEYNSALESVLLTSPSHRDLPELHHNQNIIPLPSASPSSSIDTELPKE